MDSPGLDTGAASLDNCKAGCRRLTLARPIAITALALIALSLGHPAFGGERAPGRATLENSRDAFEIDLPEGCQLTGQEGIDFDVYRVLCDGVQYVGIYVGNAADRTVPRSRLLKTPWAWPSEVQVWTVAVSKDQARADAIAASVRLTEAR